jgi:hypothetical protein
MIIRRKFDIPSALLSLRPHSAWSLNGEDYENLNWMDSGNTQPTKIEVLAEVSRLQAEYDTLEYQRQRAESYPNIKDQLDMLYWDKVNGTNNWQTAISTVKNQFPKANT